MGIHQLGLVIETMIQKNLKGLERIDVLITSHMKVFLGNDIIAIHILLEMQWQLLRELFMRKL